MAASNTKEGVVERFPFPRCEWKINMATLADEKASVESHEENEGVHYNERVSDRAPGDRDFLSENEHEHKMNKQQMTHVSANYVVMNNYPVLFQ